MYVYLKCMVDKGQFSSEYAVSAEKHDGSRFSLFVPKTMVRCKVPKRGPVSGLLMVTRLESRDGLSLVRLPDYMLEGAGGNTVTVRNSQIERTFGQTRRGLQEKA